MCQTLIGDMGYTLSELRSVNSNQLLDRHTQCIVSNLGIKKSDSFRETHRGCRAGSSIKKSNRVYTVDKRENSIPTIKSSTRVANKQLVTCNPSNLIDVPVTKWDIPSLLNANICSINHKYFTSIAV